MALQRVQWKMNSISIQWISFVVYVNTPNLTKETSHVQVYIPQYSQETGKLQEFLL